MEEGAPRRGAQPELIAAQICQALNAAGARYLVIGGVACILHGYVRATTDLDVLIELSPDNAERVLDGLAKTEYGFAREWTARELLARPITVIGDDPAVDVFTVAWTVKYEEAVRRAASAEVEGVVIPFIGLDDLIATKRTGRLQDAADIEVLEEIKRALGDQGAGSRS
jgi:predicted nucleotidyltransferase